jgi:hypothetical protein
MSPTIGRRLAAWLAVAGLLLAVPAATSATVSGGCTAEGHASNSAGVDLTDEPVWHLRSDDVAGGSGTSPANMTSATISAYALGIAIPIVNGSGKGDTTGSIDGVSLDTFSKLGKIFVVAGHATGDGTCDGQVLIIIDDVDAMFTVLGGGGLLIFILSLGAMLLTGRAGGCLSKLIALVFGGIAATGLALSLEQFEIISPTSPVGLVIVLIGAILGFVVALRIGAPGMPKPPAEPAVASAVGSTPDDVAKAAADAPGGDAPGGDAFPPAPEPPVTGMVGSTPDDVAKGAVDMLGGESPPDELPPPDPNAPGVDVGEAPPGGVGGGSAN